MPKDPKNYVFFLETATVPEGKDLPMSAINEYFFAQKGDFTSRDVRENVLQYIPMRNALDSWQEQIADPETKRKYRAAIQKLFFGSDPVTKITERTPITCLHNQRCQGMYPFLLSHSTAPAATKKLYSTVYSRFCDYVRASTYGIIDPEIGPRERKTYDNAWKIYEDGKIDWEAFLEAVEMPYQLIGKLIYYLAKYRKYRLRISDRYKNMLSLRTDQIDFEKGTINVEAEQSYHVINLEMPLPKEIASALQLYIGTRKGLVFPRSEDTTLFPLQVERAFKKAAAKLGYKASITPSILAWAGIFSSKATPGVRFERK